MSACLFWCIPIEIFHEKRSRTDQAHIAFENIPEFWQFVEAQAAQHNTDLCESPFVRKWLAVGFETISHSTELDEGEGRTADTWPRLAKQDRPTHRESDDGSDAEQQGGNEDQQRRTQEHVHKPFRHHLDTSFLGLRLLHPTALSHDDPVQQLFEF